MLDLALRHDTDVVALADIAARQRISLPYLEQLFAKLRQGGLVVSVRGPGGGYRLARDSGAISIAHIIGAIDENIDATRCAGERNCHDAEPCLTHQLWEDLSTHIAAFLERTTLADLASSPHVQEVASRLQRRWEPRTRVRVAPPPHEI